MHKQELGAQTAENITVNILYLYKSEPHMEA